MITFLPTFALAFTNAWWRTTVPSPIVAYLDTRAVEATTVANLPPASFTLLKIFIRMIGFMIKPTVMTNST